MSTSLPAAATSVILAMGMCPAVRDAGVLCIRRRRPPNTLRGVAKHTIIRQPNQFGGRLKFFSSAADADFWDELWQSTPAAYDRAQEGHLPRHLDILVRRWFPPR